MKDFWTILFILLFIGGCGKSCEYMVDRSDNRIRQHVYKTGEIGIYELRTYRDINRYRRIDYGTADFIDSVKVFRYYEAVITIDTAEYLESKQVEL